MKQRPLRDAQASHVSKNEIFCPLSSLMQAAPTERRITVRHDRSVANRTTNLILTLLFRALLFTVTLLQARGHISLALIGSLLGKHKFRKFEHRFELATGIRE